MGGGLEITIDDMNRAEACIQNSCRNHGSIVYVGSFETWSKLINRGAYADDMGPLLKGY